MTELTNWSYSKFKSFDTCPNQYYHERVLNLYPYEETEHTLYGTEFHTAAELYVGDAVPLPEKFNYAKAMLDRLKRFSGDKLCEYKFGLTAALQPCDFDASDVWFRGIVDLLIVDQDKSIAYVIDYKTGSKKSVRYADRGQLELMALATFKHFKHIRKVKAGLLFVVAKEFIRADYLATEQHTLWRKWLANHAKLEAAYVNDIWNAKPSGLCHRHCRVTECPHNGRN